MSILFHGEAEYEGRQFQWAISESSPRIITAVVAESAAPSGASLAVVLDRKPQTETEAKRLCEALVPHLVAQMQRSR